MFDRDNFINDFVEAVKEEDLNKQADVLARLSEDDGKEFRVELIQDIVAKLKEEDGDYAEHISELENQIQILNLVEAIAQQEQDSSSEEAKDTSEAEEATKEVAADTGADVESGGYAPTAEEKAEKTEQ